MIAEAQASAGPASCGPLTIQQASTLLTVPVSTLRSWERRYEVPTTARTSGGHRRYTRRQLTLAVRMRELFDDGLTLEAAARVVRLQDELDRARARIAELESQLAAADSEPPS